MEIIEKAIMYKRFSISTFPLLEIIVWILIISKRRKFIDS